MKRMAWLVAGVVACLTVAHPGMASPIVVGGSAGTDNCFPWSCNYVGEYQQAYDKSAFSGPITITGLEFFNTQYNSGATAMSSGTWTISLSTIAAGPGGLSTTYADNPGGDNTQVFSGNLSQPWAFGDTLTILFSTPFTYNPANGNLLMDVSASGMTTPGNFVWFDANNDGVVMGRVYNMYGGPTGTMDNLGLITGFLNGPASVPEPGNLAWFGLGLALLAFGGFMARRKRLAAAIN